MRLPGSVNNRIDQTSRLNVNIKHPWIDYLLILITLLPTTVFSASATEFQLPKPTGTCTIGTRYLYFTDYNRPDFFS